MFGKRRRVSSADRPDAATKTAILQALQRVPRSGSFCGAGTIESTAPTVRVRDVGLISFPLHSHQAAQLLTVAQQAPFGRGTETVVDTSVRHTWQIDPSNIEISGRHWDQTLNNIKKAALKSLAVDEPVEAQFYKMLIYPTGGFFVSHRDTEKAPGMFATLVVVLPSNYSGGELVVCHEEQRVVLDVAAMYSDPCDIVWAVFYADCPHEVLPVKDGYRMALVFNLVRPAQSKNEIPLPPSNFAVHVSQLSTVLSAWCETVRNVAPSESSDSGDDVYADYVSDDSGGDQYNDEFPEHKLIIPLEHAYTRADLSVQSLKGQDVTRVQLLAAASHSAGCDVFIGLMSIKETGTAEPRYTSRGRRRSYWEDEDGPESFDIIEKHSTRKRLIKLQKVAGSDDAPSVWPNLKFSKSEMCQPIAIDKMVPDSVHFSGATGNEGATYARTYLRAGIVVWPCRNRQTIIIERTIGHYCARMNTIATMLPTLDSAMAEQAMLEASALAKLTLAQYSTLTFEDQEEGDWVMEDENHLELAQLMLRFKQWEWLSALVEIFCEKLNPPFHVQHVIETFVDNFSSLSHPAREKLIRHVTQLSCDRCWQEVRPLLDDIAENDTLTSTERRLLLDFVSTVRSSSFFDGFDGETEELLGLAAALDSSFSLGFASSILADVKEADAFPEVFSALYSFRDSVVPSIEQQWNKLCLSIPDAVLRARYSENTRFFSCETFQWIVDSIVQQNDRESFFCSLMFVPQMNLSGTVKVQICSLPHCSQFSQRIAHALVDFYLGEQPAMGFRVEELMVEDFPHVMKHLLHEFPDAAKRAMERLPDVVPETHVHFTIVPLLVALCTDKSLLSEAVFRDSWGASLVTMAVNSRAGMFDTLQPLISLLPLLNHSNREALIAKWTLSDSAPCSLLLSNVSLLEESGLCNSAELAANRSRLVRCFSSDLSAKPSCGVQDSKDAIRLLSWLSVRDIGTARECVSTLIRPANVDHLKRMFPELLNWWFASKLFSQADCSAHGWLTKYVKMALEAPFSLTDCLPQWVTACKVSPDWDLRGHLLNHLLWCQPCDFDRCVDTFVHLTVSNVCATAELASLGLTLVDKFTSFLDAINWDPATSATSATYLPYATYRTTVPPLDTVSKTAAVIVKVMESLIPAVPYAADRAAAAVLIKLPASVKDKVLETALSGLAALKRSPSEFHAVFTLYQGLRDVLTSFVVDLPRPRVVNREFSAACNCQHCSAVGKFLKSTDSSLTIAAAKKVRDHVMTAIRGLDVDLQTVTAYTPQRLVITNRQASYNKGVAVKEVHAARLQKYPAVSEPALPIDGHVHHGAAALASHAVGPLQAAGTEAASGSSVTAGTSAAKTRPPVPVIVIIDDE